MNSDFKIKNIVNSKSLPIITMGMFYLFIFVGWMESYWYSDVYLNEYLRLQVATFVLADFDSWLDQARFYDFYSFVFPALLLWRHPLPRLLFYICFLGLYLFPAPNPTFTMLGLVSDTFYTLVPVFVGILLCSDILKFSNQNSKLVRFIQSNFYPALVWLVGLAAVATSLFAKRAERIEFVQQQAAYSNENINLLVGMPTLQVILFVALSCGVFIRDNVRKNAIIVSWLVLLIVVPMRIEWNTHLVLVDIYILLSAVLLWANHRAQSRRNAAII